MNNVVRRLVSVVVALAFIVVFSPVEPVAHGAAPLSISSIFCESIGGGRFICDGSASGGSGNYSYSWTGVTNAGISQQNGGFARGTCRVNSSASVRLTVTDGTGASVSRNSGFYCYRIAP